jgi:quercetin dioxygenase-like cupin family protein
MSSRRYVLRSGLAGLLGIRLTNAQLRRMIARQELPPVNLEGWDCEIMELTFPPGFSAAPHHHSGFVIGYVLEGDFRFQVEGEPELIYKQGQTFFEPPGAHHIVAASASLGQSARVLVILFGEKGKPKTFDL